jgi:two-component system chemotaxis response regulator CheY
MVREMLVGIVRRHGYPVLVAEDGLRAIHVIEQHEPAAEHLGLILLDLMLPVINGVELIAALVDYLDGVPIVATSGNLGLLEQAAAAGATAVLAKPFKPSDLSSLIGRCWVPREVNPGPTFQTQLLDSAKN